MGRSPCCEKEHTNKGAWTKEEDELLINYIRSHGDGSWRSLPKAAGLQRCGKSCRLRWINYLRPDLKRGHFTKQEDDLIIHLHSLVGNKWSMIASRLPGRTDNEIKNYWNTHIKRKLISAGIDPRTHHPVPVVVHTSTSSSNPSTAAATVSSSNTSNTSLNNNINYVVASLPILTSSPATSITAAKPSSCSWNQQQQQQQHPPPPSPLPLTVVSEYSNSSGSSSSSSSSALTSEELVLHSLQPAGVQAQAQAQAEQQQQQQPDLELSIGLPRRCASFRPYDFQKQHPAFGINNLPNSTKTLMTTTRPKGVCLCYRLGLEKSEAPSSSSCNCRGTFPSRIRWC